VGNTFMVLPPPLDGGAGGTSPTQIACGPVQIGGFAGGGGYASVVSINNMYTNIAPGGYAPLYNGPVAPALLTGPTSTWRGNQSAVLSFGDSTRKGDGSQTVQLAPWLGTTPNVGQTGTQPCMNLSPSPIPNGSSASVITGVTGNLGDFVTVSCDQAVPAGVVLGGAINGSHVTVTAINMSGGPQTLSGNLICTVWPRV
jgi:hypothetical protein